MRRPTFPTPATAPDNIKGHIRAMLGLMVGVDTDQTIQMSTQFRREQLPLDMPDEGFLLEALYYCKQRDLPPTRENVNQLLEISGVKNPAEFVLNLINETQNTSYSIGELSGYIDFWIERGRMNAAAAKIMQLSGDPSRAQIEVYRDMVRTLSAAAPKRYEGSSYTSEELADHWFAMNQELVRANKAGKDVGPNLPFEAARAFFPRLKWKETTTILGREGSGKTTLLCLIAEYIAWRQRLVRPCDFVIFILETPEEVVQARNFSRHTLIPSSALTSGAIDLESDRWKPVWEKYKEGIRALNDKAGTVHYEFISRPGLNEVILKMERLADASHALGRDVCFGIDYMQKFLWQDTGAASEREGYQEIGEALADINRRLGSHLFLLAQEGDKEGEAFGSSVIRKISQLVLRIALDIDPNTDRPKKATKDIAYYKKPGEPEKDAMGGTRYIQRIGQDVGLFGLTVSKANDAPAETISLIRQPEYNIVYQNPEQIKKLQMEGRLPVVGKTI